MNKENTKSENENNDMDLSVVAIDKSSDYNNKNYSDWDKYIYTICLFFNHFAFGITFNLFGPAMIDMKYIFNTSMSYISLFNTFNEIGYLLGSLCGLLYIYINRQKTLILMVTILGVGTILIIYCPNIWTLYLCALVAQTGGGAWDNASGVWLIEMWKNKSPPFLQFLQFMFGMGCIVAPLLDKPFLTGEIKSNNFYNSSVSTTTGTDINDNIDRRSKLKLPFIIGGSLQLIVPPIFLIMLFLKKYKPPKNIFKKEESSDTEIQRGDKSNFGIKLMESPRKDRNLLIGLIAIELATYVSVELIQFQFSPTYYQYIDLQISAQKAAEMVSVMAVCFTIGRLICAFIAIKISPEIMIICHYCIIIISMLLLYFGQNYETILWIGNGMIGFGFSAVWPAIFAFADKYVKLTNNVSTVFTFSSGLVPLISPFIIGPYIEKNPFILIAVQTFYLIISLGLFITVMFKVKRSSIVQNKLSLNKQ